MEAALAGMEPDHFWAMTLFAGAFALGAFVAAFRYLHRARTVENTPTALIRSAAQGYVELEGRSRLMDGPPVVAPLTGRHCCWWRYKIEQQTRDRKGTHWHTIDDQRGDELFLLEDMTGCCVVDPHGAEVEHGSVDVWYGSRPRPDVPPSVGSGWFRRIGATYRYTEWRLEINGPLYAIGQFRTQAGTDAHHQAHGDEVRALLRDWKSDPKMRAVLDVNGDGEIDQKEWDAARRMAENRAARAAIDQPLPPDLHVLSRPPDGRPFLLAGVSQERLVRRYKLRSAGWLAASLVLGSFVTLALEARHVL